MNILARLCLAAVLCSRGRQELLIHIKAGDGMREQRIFIKGEFGGKSCTSINSVRIFTRRLR